MSKPTDTTISHGVISVIGRRRSMEDAVTVAPALVHLTKPHPAGKEKEQAQLMTYDFFAVYDGHGVQRISQRCKERLHHVVAEEFLVAGGVDNWDNVMTTSFARMDDEMAKECGVNPAATVVRPTALVVMVGKDQIVVANCGDSRAVLCTDGVALPLSNDHKPGRPDNKQRLEAADDGDLKPYVISSPEVTVHKRTISDDFMVIASDGLWDMVSNETACDIVRKCCSDEVVSSRLLDGVIGNCAAASAAMLVELALARGSKDNISVIVVELQPLHARGGSSST